MSETPDTDGEKRSRAATRRKLVEAAAPVFVDKGLEAASVADLCAAAGFTRGAFYSNFASKNDLAVAVYAARVDRLVDLLHSECQRQVEQELPADAVLSFALSALSGLTDDGPWQGFRIDMHLAADRDPQMRAAVDTQYERIVATLTAVLEHARRRGLHYRIAQQDLARILIAVWDGELLRAGRRMTPGEGVGAQLITATWQAFVFVDEAS